MSKKRTKKEKEVLLIEVPTKDNINEMIIDVQSDEGNLITDTPITDEILIDETPRPEEGETILEELSEHEKQSTNKGKTKTRADFTNAEMKALLGNFSRRTLIARYGIHL